MKLWSTSPWECAQPSSNRPPISKTLRNPMSQSKSGDERARVVEVSIMRSPSESSYGMATVMFPPSGGREPRTALTEARSACLYSGTMQVLTSYAYWYYTGGYIRRGLRFTR